MVVTYQFSVDLEVSEAEERLNVCILEGDEPKALGATSLAVQHNCRVDHLAELREELAHGLGGDAARQPADEQFRRALVLLARYCAFWVNL